jgi:hypothetical protein
VSRTYEDDLKAFGDSVFHIGLYEAGDEEGYYLRAMDGERKVKCWYHGNGSIYQEVYCLGGGVFSRPVKEGPCVSQWDADGNLFWEKYYETWPGYYHDAAGEIVSLDKFIHYLEGICDAEFGNKSTWIGSREFSISPYHMIYRGLAVPLYMKTGVPSVYHVCKPLTRQRMITRLRQQAAARHRWLREQQDGRPA